MKINEAETLFRIHNLNTMLREIPKEKDAQLATMMRMFHGDIPDYIADMKELNEYRRKYGRMDEHAREPHATGA